jgi:hypothetical protein
MSRTKYDLTDDDRRESLRPRRISARERDERLRRPGSSLRRYFQSSAAMVRDAVEAAKKEQER